MIEFDFHFEHKSKRSNHVADALSQKVELATLRLLANMSASVMNTPIRKCVRENLDKDPIVKTIFKLVQERMIRQF